MEEKNKQIELPEGEPLVGKEKARGSGSLLSIARLEQKKTIEEVANDLNLSVDQIKKIESDQTEGLPEVTYVRGYIRSYAKLVGLDPEVILKSYLNPNWQQTNNLIDIPSGIGEIEEPRSDSGKFFRSLGLLAIVLGLAVILFYFLGLFDSSSSNPQKVTINNSLESNLENNNDSIEVSSSTADIVDLAVQTNQDTLTVITDAPVEDVAAHRLYFTFQETSWVDIRDESNNRLAYQSYAKGEELEINSESALTIFLGNASGVTVLYNNSDFDITKFKQGVYAKFSIGN